MLVELMGGKISANSELNKGSEFRFVIPLSSSQEVKEEEKQHITLPPQTILVVDDEVALSHLMEEILTGQGYDVLCADDAQKALEILKNNSVDLMISDVIMPGMDGYQLATEVEKLYPMVKIQIVSGFSDGRKVGLSNDSLHEQRLSKPVSIKVLLRRVKDLLDA